MPALICRCQLYEYFERARACVRAHTNTVSRLCRLHATRLLIWPFKTSVSGNHGCFVMLHSQAAQGPPCTRQPALPPSEPTAMTSRLLTGRKRPRESQYQRIYVVLKKKIFFYAFLLDCMKRWLVTSEHHAQTAE